MLGRCCQRTEQRNIYDHSTTLAKVQHGADEEQGRLCPFPAMGVLRTPHPSIQELAPWRGPCQYIFLRSAAPVTDAAAMSCPGYPNEYSGITRIHDTLRCPGCAFVAQLQILAIRRYCRDVTLAGVEYCMKSGYAFRLKHHPQAGEFRPLLTAVRWQDSMIGDPKATSARRKSYSKPKHFIQTSHFPLLPWPKRSRESHAQLQSYRNVVLRRFIRMPFTSAKIVTNSAYAESC